MDIGKRMTRWGWAGPLGGGVTLHAFRYPDTDGDPHAVKIPLTPEDFARYESQRSREGALPPDQLGAWVTIHHAETGEPFEVRSAPCHLHCRCACQARSLVSAN